MAPNIRPSCASRDSVHVELRASTSIEPDFSASKRSCADSGVKRTFVASLKIAAASARQKSTSRPAQVPLAFCAENPSMPWLTPQ
jgi:hypothetical protein